MIIRTFGLSFLFLILGLFGAYFINHRLSDVFVVAILIILEISISFDNAVVNAKVLKHMTPFWQTMFLTVGILIAVFGMRLVFPILIVALTSGHSFLDVIHMALYAPKQYQSALELAFPVIYPFGAGFLWMVFWHFLCDPHKKHNWIPRIENAAFVRLFKKHIIWTYALPLVVAIAFLFYSIHSAIALALGVLINGVLTWFNQKFTPEKGAETLMASGLIAFLYLEVLDASFSIDGVLGAFALSSHIFIILIGLGVGAFFVRSMTIYLVKRDTLARFLYLEHGAHYAIGFLAIVLFLECFIHVPTLITGLVGVCLILKSLWDSRG